MANATGFLYNKADKSTSNSLNPSIFEGLVTLCAPDAVCFSRHIPHASGRILAERFYVIGTLQSNFLLHKKRPYIMYSRFLQITLLLFCFVKDLLIQSTVLMCNDRCADSVTGDVDCCSCHIQDTVDTHDQTNCLNRKTY